MNSLNITPCLLVLLTLHTTSGQDITCEDCTMIMTEFKNMSMYNADVIAFEQEVIVANICPGADLGDADAHPNCERFTEHHWPDLMRELSNKFIDADMCINDFGVCPSASSRILAPECDACMGITQLVGEFIGQEEMITQMVAYLVDDFCLTGVPEPDLEFCKEYADVVVPPLMRILSATTIDSQSQICTDFFNVCNRA